MNVEEKDWLDFTQKLLIESFNCSLIPLCVVLLIAISWSCYHRFSQNSGRGRGRNDQHEMHHERNCDSYRSHELWIRPVNKFFWLIWWIDGQNLSKERMKSRTNKIKDWRKGAQFWNLELKNKDETRNVKENLWEWCEIGINRSARRRLDEFMWGIMAFGAINGENKV
jgi:hypothetical protein